MADPDAETRPTDAALGETLDSGVRPPTDVPRWLGERYRIVRTLGRGGMGTVYLAVDEALGVEVALKAITDEVGDALPRLRDEVRLAQKVTHTSICRTYDLEEIEGHWLIKMEYVPGETLADRLRRGRLPVAEAVAVATKICAGLAVAHEQGVVHRDLKPHNIMLQAAGGRVVLMDFGIARTTALAGKTAESVSGTPDYMAPEQVRGREVDGRADLYSLGCVLHEMLSGHRVFPRDSPMAAALAHVHDPPPSLPAHVPAHVARVVGQLLEKDAARRPTDAAQVAAKLARPPRHLRGWLVAGALTVLAAAGAFAATRHRQAPAPWRAQITPLATHDENSSSPVFSPDGKWLAFPSDRESRGAMRAYISPVDGGAARAISPRGLDVNEVRWERSGRALLLSGGERRIHRVPLDGGPPELLAEGARWVEDCGGRLVVLFDGSPGCAQCQRFVVREPGVPDRELRQFPAGSTVAYPRCDRPGRRLLYSLTDMIYPVKFAPYDLWLLPLDGGGDPERLTNDRALNIGAFTPDGGAIVYSAVTRGSHLWTRSLAGDAGAPVQLTFGGGAEFEPDVSPDGRQVIYDVDLTSSALFRQPMGGGRPLRLTSDYTFLTHPQPTPDGREIIAEALPGVIVSIASDGGDPVGLADGRTPSLSPDGAEILYSDGDRVLALPRRDGASPRPVGKVPGAVLELVVGPDARAHLMVALPGGWEAWSVPLAGGTAERELPAPWSHLVPAPRGGWRAAVRMIDRVHWRARFLPPGSPLDAPGLRELEGGAQYASYAWSADGGSWFYRKGGELRRFEVERGEDHVVSDEGGLQAVSSDGETLFTTHLVGSVSRELITNFNERR